MLRRTQESFNDEEREQTPDRRIDAGSITSDQIWVNEFWPDAMTWKPEEGKKVL
jgi:hypothetical protein